LNDEIARLEVDIAKAEVDVLGLAKQKDELAAMIPKLKQEGSITRADSIQGSNNLIQRRMQRETSHVLLNWKRRSKSNLKL